jgi:hypothetical protein
MKYITQGQITAESRDLLPATRLGSSMENNFPKKKPFMVHHLKHVCDGNGFRRAPSAYGAGLRAPGHLLSCWRNTSWSSVQHNLASACSQSLFITLIITAGQEIVTVTLLLLSVFVHFIITAIIAAFAA